MMTPNASRSTVMLLDPHPIFRAGLTDLLEDRSELRVVWSGGDPEEAISCLRPLQPAVLVMEYHLKKASAPEVLRRVHEVLPELPVVILTGESKEIAIRESLEAGATGYLLKENGPDVLLPALRAAARGDAVLDPILAGLVLRWVQQMTDEAPVRFDELTAREIQTVRLVAQGWTNKQIAEELVLSIRTVENHLRNVYLKLGFSDRAQLVRYAIQHGLLPAPQAATTSVRERDRQLTFS